MRAYVARHGETDWNRAGRYQGRKESSLTELGRRQATALAAQLAGEEQTPQRIISSPLGRCVETARPLAELLEIEIECDDRLIEIAHGVWEGRLRDEIEANDAGTMLMWRHDPAQVAFVGGETIVQVRDRWRAFAADLHGTSPIAIVTHDVVVRLAILDARGAALDDFWTPRVANGAYATLDIEGSQRKLVSERTDAHLSGIAADISSQAL